MQELMAKVAHSNAQIVGCRTAFNKGLTLVISEDVQHASSIATDAQESFRANHELMRLVKNSPCLAKYRVGQLDPGLRNACVSILIRLGISGHLLQNTATAATLVCEVLGKVLALNLRILCGGCNSELLQHYPGGTERTRLHNVPAPVAASRVVAGAVCSTGAGRSPAMQQTLAESVMLVMQLGSSTQQNDFNHCSLVWMAMCLKITLLEESMQAGPPCQRLPLGPVLINHIICKALYHVRDWIQNVNGQWCETSGSLEQLLPPLGPIQVLFCSIY